MELKNYLRHEYVAKRRQGDQKMFEDQLFDIMQVNFMELVFEIEMGELN